jgi:hypothetical protein
VDWATVITGVVGVAGIGGTLLSARLTSKSDAANLRTSISAEDARANRTEKRRIYAGCVAAVTAYFDAIVAAGTGSLVFADERAGLDAEVGRTRLAAQVAVSEVDLIAPTEVAIMAHRAVQAVLRASEGGSTSDTSASIISLMMAMRGDLGADDDSAGELTIAPAPGKPGKLA